MKSLYIYIKSSFCDIYVYKSYLDIFLHVMNSVFLVNNIYLFHPCSVIPLYVVLSNILCILFSKWRNTIITYKHLALQWMVYTIVMNTTSHNKSSLCWVNVQVNDLWWMSETRRGINSVESHFLHKQLRSEDTSVQCHCLFLQYLPQFMWMSCKIQLHL